MTLFSCKGELWLKLLDNFNLKKIANKNDMNEVNEVCSWQRHEVSNKVNT